MIAHEVYGNKEGPLLVFLHGGGVASWMWNNQIQHFTNYFCLLPTLQGHGVRSVEDHFSIQENAIEIAELIDHYKGNRNVYVVGFSIGSQIAIKIISLFPDLVQKAMLNSPLIKPSSFMRQLIPFLVTATFPLIKNKSFAKVQAKQLYITEDLFHRYYEDSTLMKRDLLIKMLQENSSFQLPSNFGESPCKILATVGSKEKKMMKQSISILCEKHDHCTPIMIEKIGHGFPLAKPTFFNELLEQFLLSDDDF